MPANRRRANSATIAQQDAHTSTRTLCRSSSRGVGANGPQNMTKSEDRGAQQLTVPAKTANYAVRAILSQVARNGSSKRKRTSPRVCSSRTMPRSVNIFNAFCMLATARSYWSLTPFESSNRPEVPMTALSAFFCTVVKDNQSWVYAGSSSRAMRSNARSTDGLTCYVGRPAVRHEYFLGKM
jgi:hypothetical protein